jgi:4-amino-4-deoxy-L-arabinose transferase-like glycosyltransferase
VKLSRSAIWILGVILAAAAGWKIFLLLRDVVPFNADEAIVALMARHILQGERPIFFYGQAYMGSLDAYLVAMGFLLFGQQVWVVRLVQTVLYMGTLVSTAWLGEEAFPGTRTGLAAAALLAIPAVNVSLYTTASLGGYGEALLIGTLSLALTVRLGRKPSAPGFLLWGFLSGLGLWADALTMVFSLPALVYLIWKLCRAQKGIWTKALAFALLGGLLGSAPWWLYAFQHGFQNLILELTGSAVAVEKTSWLVRSGLHLVNFLLIGLPAAFGLRPPWSVDWLVLPLLPFALIAWIAVLVFLIRMMLRPSTERPLYCLIGGVILVLFLAFLFTSFGVDPSGRYFLPVAIPLALAAAQLAHRIQKPKWGQAALLVFLIGYQLGGNIQTALRVPPGLTTQFDQTTILDHSYDRQLIEFLRKQGETRGYANYWVSYPLDFLSGGDIVFVPRLPYHADLRYTSRDDRYLPFDRKVEEAARVAYISVKQTPLLDAQLRNGFARQGVTYQEQVIGDYNIFYGLSHAVRPVDLGIAEKTDEEN